MTASLYQPISLASTIVALHEQPSALVDMVSAACDRIEQVNPRLQALLPEPEFRARLLREAEALQARAASDLAAMPLYGALLGVKDIISVDGFPTKAGSQLPPELFDGPEAASARALRAAGALVVGKTVTTEFAYFEPGPTRNPHNLDHTPGGSSSGSAAAVAAGLCALTIGTQTIGSVIRPAAFCGVVGFKPSFGRVDRAGVLLIASSLDHVGFFTADVASMAAVAPVVCADWKTEQTSEASLPLLGVPDGPYLDQATPEARAAFEAQLRQLEAQGYTIRRVRLLDDIAEIAELHRDMMAVEMARVHEEWFARYGDLYRPRTVALIRRGQATSDERYEEARQRRISLLAELESAMRAEAIDLWLCPAALGPAPAGLDSTGDPTMSFPWTFTGMPALSLPAGYAANGLPLGLQVVAAFWQDERLLAWSVGLERALSQANAG